MRIDDALNLRLGFHVIEKAIEDYFDYAIQHRVKHLEIDLNQNHSCVDSFDTERIQAVRMFSEKNGISLSLHTPTTLDLAERSPRFRRKTMEYLERCIVLAHLLNVQHVTTHLGCFYGWHIWPSMRQKALSRLALSLEHIEKICRQYGVILAMENVIKLPRGACNTLLGDHLSDFQYIFSVMDSSFLNLCLDLGHAHMCEGSFAYIDAFPNKIACVHFHDNHGEFDEHLPVGEGTVPWEKTLLALKKIHYSGPIVSECGGTQPHEALKLFKEFWVKTEPGKILN